MTATGLAASTSPVDAGEVLVPARDPSVRRARRPRRGRGLFRAVVAALVVVAASSVVTSDRRSDPLACTTVAGRAIGDLTTFTSWLHDNQVEGVVGEVGWPSTADDEWRGVATPWLATAVDSGVGAYVWGAAEQWPPDYPLAVYRNAPDATFVAGEQAPLAETFLAGSASGGAAAALRGVALSGPSFAAGVDEEGSSYSSGRLGTRGVDYQYPSWRFLVRLHERGITSVRLAVMWERLQPRLGGPLDAGELAEVRRVMQSAETLGMSVVVDLHNYGRYAEAAGDGRRVLLVGSDELPASVLADVWRRVAGALRGSPALAAYGLMNEPHDLPGGAPRWEATTREVVAAVREVDATTLVLVPGYGWSSAAAWQQNHPAPWVRDPHVAYEAHQYFDTDRSGRYSLPFEREVALAARSTCESS